MATEMVWPSLADGWW